MVFMDHSDANEGFAPLDREGLVQRVARRLSKAIVSGQLTPGERLSESVVARQLGVSRAPVREAARLLENSGLVTYLPNRGFFVRKFSAEELDNLYELRIIIETAAIRRLIREGLGDTEAALEAQIQELHRVAGPGHDMLTQVEADMQFHRLICAGSGNPRFLGVFEQIALHGRSFGENGFDKRRRPGVGLAFGFDDFGLFGTGRGREDLFHDGG